MFDLDTRLKNDTVPVGQFPLSLVLLSRDSQYPWCILVPQREDVTEIFQLDNCDRTQLLEESTLLSRTMVDLFKPDKMNLATIGNVVPQLHMHHVARFKSDPCWPKPVWGSLPARPYLESRLHVRLDALRQALHGEGLCI